MPHLKKIEMRLATQASGPYAQNVVTESMLLAAGQRPLDPGTSKLDAATI